MGWVSKYDTTFIIYVDRKFNKRFANYDNFSYWLYYEKNKENKDDFYVELEEIFKEYCDWQTKKVKENREVE